MCWLLLCAREWTLSRSHKFYKFTTILSITDRPQYKTSVHVVSKFVSVLAHCFCHCLPLQLTAHAISVQLVVHIYEPTPTPSKNKFFRTKIIAQYRGPTKEGQARECRAAFSSLLGFFYGVLRHLKSSRRSLACGSSEICDVSFNAEFMVSFCTLMSENLCECHFFPNRV